MLRAVEAAWADLEAEHTREDAEGCAHALRSAWQRAWASLVVAGQEDGELDFELESARLWDRGFADTLLRFGTRPRLQGLLLLDAVTRNSRRAQEEVLRRLDVDGVVLSLSSRLAHDVDAWEAGTRLVNRSAGRYVDGVTPAQLACMLDGLLRHGAASTRVAKSVATLLRRLALEDEDEGGDVGHEDDEEDEEDAEPGPLQVAAEAFFALDKDAVATLCVCYGRVDGRDKGAIRSGAVALCCLAGRRMSASRERTLRLTDHFFGGTDVLAERYLALPAATAVGASPAKKNSRVKNKNNKSASRQWGPRCLEQHRDLRLAYERRPERLDDRPKAKKAKKAKKKKKQHVKRAQTRKTATTTSATSKRKRKKQLQPTDSVLERAVEAIAPGKFSPADVRSVVGAVAPTPRTSGRRRRPSCAHHDDTQLGLSPEVFQAQLQSMISDVKSRLQVTPSF